MERTLVIDGNGTELLLKDVSKTQGEGKRTMQFYPAIKGIDLDQYRLNARWEVSSPAPFVW